MLSFSKFLYLAALIVLSYAGEVFVNSSLIYTKGGLRYYPDLSAIPEGTKLVKIGLSIGGQIDRISFSLQTPSGNILVYDSFGSSTR